MEKIDITSKNFEKELKTVEDMEDPEELDKYAVHLEDAMRDLDVELTSLTEQKGRLEGRADDVSDDISSTEKKELNLENTLRELKEKEKELNGKKDKLVKKIDEIADRKEKVLKIRKQIKSV